MTSHSTIKSAVTGTFTCAAVTCAALVAGGGLAEAREPGVPPVMPPGQTMGVPIAAPLPEGFYASLSTGYYITQLTDGLGDRAGQKATVIDPALQLVWVPGWELLGASVKMFIVQPVVYVDQERTAPFPAAQQGHDAKWANANFQIHPVDLTWTLAPGLFVNAGFSVFVPTGQWGASEFINIGGNFWTFSPSLGVTWLRDGWNVSLEGIYFTNTENTELNYTSGDEVMLSATVTKDLGGFSLGPVAYYYKQVTDDENAGTAYGGTIQEKGEKLGVGAALNTQIGATNLLLMYTYDAYARNTISGGKAWISVSYKFH